MRPLLKTHGGKWFLKDWIIGHFPKGYEQMTYVEPFIGGGSILLNKNPSVREVINDLDTQTYRVWKCMRHHFSAFLTDLSTLTYSEQTFNHYKSLVAYDITTAGVKEFVLRRMSRGGLKKSFAKSNRLRGGKMGDENAWETAIKNLPEIASRIKDVRVKCRYATDLIQEFDSVDTLFYCDPPYLHSTRKSKYAYSREMTEKDHIDLLGVLIECKGKVILSGYDSVLYRNMLGHWNRVVKRIVNHSSQTKAKQTKEEVIWKNF